MAVEHFSNRPSPHISERAWKIFDSIRWSQGFGFLVRRLERFALVQIGRVARPAEPESRGSPTSIHLQQGGSTPHG